jgi:Cu-Zn family superoxide dismutase
MSKPEVHYAMLAGPGGLKGTAVVLTLPTGEHEVFVRLEGLKPGSGNYANHIHYNDKGDANCAAQNGDKILGLANLTADANGNAVAATKLPASVKYPAGTTYVNVHSNSPQPVGASIACGMVEMK